MPLTARTGADVRLKLESEQLTGSFKIRGATNKLLELGATAGATVVIGPEDNAVVFDWEPTISAGAPLTGPRGSDDRLYQ